MARRDGLKVAMVTGAGSGLGKALCKALGAQNWTVVATDINLEAAEATVVELRGLGGAGEAWELDVRDGEAQVALAQRVFEEYGRCDLVVNNAGVAVSGDIGEVSLDDWRWCVDIDLMGPVYGCHAFAPLMREQGYGHIVNIASIAGYAQAVRMGPYNVAKAGVIALSETLRAELLDTDVGVTVVCPAFFKTQIIQNMRSPEHDKKMGQKFLDHASMTADDVAQGILQAVAKNEPFVVMPKQAQLLWWMRRLMPARATEVIMWMAERTRKRAEARAAARASS